MKTTVLDFLFNKVAVLKAYNFIKKRLQHRCFPVNIAKILRTAFFKRTPLVAATWKRCFKITFLQHYLF